MFFTFASIKASAQETDNYNEEPDTLRRVFVRNFSKTYSYNGAVGVLNITYTIDASTGKIKEIVSSGISSNSPGKWVRVDSISYSGNTVNVKVSFSTGTSQIDTFNLY